ncbi:hypothetical protein JZ751_029096 [Albula glossodonta]|uniref:Uncharacterized protein n=1 Tax=Albula glossodonta TaxID=121402 RepID=A0A8T2P955_9TELE|nr:hypothetical protein JZ751_029096 [Albula glossodonta]
MAGLSYNAIGVPDFVIVLRVRTAPHEFGSMQIEVLNFSGNRFEELPTQCLKLQRLKVASFGNQGNVVEPWGAHFVNLFSPSHLPVKVKAVESVDVCGRMSCAVLRNRVSPVFARHMSGLFAPASPWSLGKESGGIREENEAGSPAACCVIGCTGTACSSTSRFLPSRRCASNSTERLCSLSLSSVGF